VVSLSPTLFPQRNYPIGKPFLGTLAAQYGAGVHPVDYAGGKALDLINQWVRQQTAGRIPRVFDSLDPSTRLVLANTVYLRADWDHDLFAEGGATDAPFTRADRSQITVKVMHAADHLRYASADGWQAVELPYAGGQLAMRVLLPPPGQPPSAMLAPQTMTAVAAGLHERNLSLSLPRWDFTTDLDLEAALRRIGLTAPFQPDADFSGIAPGLYIQQAVHRANITVDEWGTEAAAVTGLAFPSSAKVPPPLRVDVDRPFAFAIVHTATGAPLFLGQVTDPSAR
jgi:serine protease inhibitor